MIEEERGLSGNNNGEVFVGFGTKEGRKEKMGLQCQRCAPKLKIPLFVTKQLCCVAFYFLETTTRSTQTCVCLQGVFCNFHPILVYTLLISNNLQTACATSFSSLLCCGLSLIKREFLFTPNPSRAP
jgi:hypothetical protein